MAGLPEHRAPNLTRRGTLAYYLAAWVCGGLFFSAVLFLGAPKDSDFGPTLSARSFLLTYFFVLAWGWAPAIALSFLLRKIAGVLRWERAWPWSVGAAILTVAFVTLLALAGKAHLGPSSWLRFMSEFFEWNGENGALLTSRRTLWGLGLILAGMTTGFLLYRVDRAFTPLEDATITDSLK